MATPRIKVTLPPEFYKWSWNLIPATWTFIEWLAINDENDECTWTAHTRPVLQEEPLLKASFVLFVLWIVKHYLLDKSEKIA